MDTGAIVNLVLFGILFIGTFVGFVKGFLEQAIELAGAVASFVFAILLSGSVAAWLESRWDAPYSLWLVVGFVVLLVGGLMATHYLALALGRVIKMTVLKLVDRFTGAVLGLITGMLIGSLAIWLVLELPLPNSFRRDVARSEMTLFLRPLAAQVFDWVVERTKNDIRFEDIFKRGKTV